MTASQSCVSVVPLEQEECFAAAPPVKAVYFFFSSFLPFTFPGICASALPYLCLFLIAETWIVLPIIAAVNKSKSLETGISPHKKHNFCQIMSPSKPVVCLCRFLSKMADRQRKTAIEKLHNLSLLCLYLVSALLTKGFSLEPTPFSQQMTLLFQQQTSEISNKTDGLQLRTSWKYPPDSADGTAAFH